MLWLILVFALGVGLLVGAFFGGAAAWFTAGVIIVGAFIFIIVKLRQFAREEEEYSRGQSLYDTMEYEAEKEAKEEEETEEEQE